MNQVEAHPVCKKCGGNLIWNEFGSMGSSHSNIYKCVDCGRKVEIYDHELWINLKKEF